MKKHKNIKHLPRGRTLGGEAPAHSEILQVTGRLGLLQSLDSRSRFARRLCNRERKCADTIGTVPVPGLAISSAKI